MKKIFTLATVLTLATLFHSEVYSQICTTNGSEASNVSLAPSCSDQQTLASQGVGAGSSRYYLGFSPNVYYTISLDNAHCPEI
jgi:hypothetical protein